MTTATPTAVTVRGTCTLVGAGPGDPDLLTLKAVKAMRQASVLLVDDLVSDAVLAMALKGRRTRPRVVHVGKRGGCASTPQAFIERLMIAEAQRGERVVRLKGGDPFIFGRGGEEAEHLRAAGIEVEVVNGITSGLAAATALGVPLTHRDHAHGVIFVTGHARDAEAELDWATLGAAAAQGLTLVIYMGVSQAERLQAGLLHHLAAHTPAAAVQHASLPQQRTVLTNVAGLATTLRGEGIGSPAILIVGDVLRGVAALAAPARDTSHAVAA
ncbi:uroporphyrinogen-III C-methyltransferase [Ideonella sp. BN130291]|uniref:uroporphyrinogen-III C-methyltransferase n=1 Tax=Ideonella sp. BN130291 TaxID=3112940 RepID=UPI002E25D2CB|nr:uroporphyrinogen-III C-methyltransferase [Ideonella sp. BN130291]